MSAKVMPALLTPIQVPPLSSRGYSASNPSRSRTSGGKADIRESLSSRFIARTKPSSRGRKVTLHIAQSAKG